MMKINVRFVQSSEQIKSDSMVRRWVWQIIERWNSLLQEECSGRKSAHLWQNSISAVVENNFFMHMKTLLLAIGISGWRYCQTIYYCLDNIKGGIVLRYEDIQTMISRWDECLNRSDNYVRAYSKVLPLRLYLRVQ